MPNGRCAALATILTLALGLVARAQDSVPETAPAKPNFVVILIDDLGWRDLGLAGHPLHKTPNIDALAHRGTIFFNAYSNGPNCAPSRASIISGRYPPAHGIYTVGSSERGSRRNRKLVPIENRTDLEESLTTLPEVLRSRGYATAAIGKWHLGDDPTDHGFDVNVAGTAAGHPTSYWSPYRNDALPNGPRGEYLTTRMTNEAVRFIASNPDRPFLLYLSYFAVHTPIQPRHDLAEQYRQLKDADKRLKQFDSGYAAMVTAVDQGVGTIIDAIEQLELRDNTFIFFMSDNGGLGRYASMSPLRGEKGTLYEGGIRVPLIIDGPGLQQSAIIREPVSGVDLLPTIVDMAGLDIETIVPHPLTDGMSLLPIIRADAPNATLDRPAIFWHFPAYLQAYDRGVDPWRTTPAGAVRAGQYKLLEFFEDGRLELYDLDADPGETTNLALTEPDIRDRLLEMLRAWRTEANAPVPTTPNPFHGHR